MKNGISIDYGNNTLTNAEWHFLSSNAIEWKMLPTKLAYREGDALDVTGGAITTYYDYEIVEEETLTVDMVSGFDNTKAGTQTLTVMFEGQTTTFSVTVSHLYGEPVYENEVAPTCTEEGHYDKVVYCTGCGEELSRESVTIPALGHEWGEPVYTWTKTEEGYAATATAVCQNDETHILEEEGTVTYRVIIEPTDQTEGLGQYIAVFTNELFAMQTYVAVIPVLVPTLYGDVNVDGRVSTADAALILRALVGLNELSIQNMLNAEVDGDGTVTAADAAMILRHIVGLIDAFPVEE